MDSAKLMFAIVLMIYGVYRFINSVSKIKQAKLEENRRKLNEKRKVIEQVMRKTVIIFSIFLFTAFYPGCKFDEIKSVSTTGDLAIVVDENVEPLMKS